MGEQKTKPTEKSVEEFLDAISDEQVRDDCYELVRIMSQVTGEKPVLWGGNIIGFGKYHYKYASGHEGDACLTAFSPRKANLSIYVMPGSAQHAALLEKLGKHKAGKGCLSVKKLEDLDLKVLEKLINLSVTELKDKYKQ